MKALWLSALLCLSGAANALALEEARESLQATFPNLSIDRLEAGPADNIATVIAGDTVFYYLPKEQVLFFGEFYSKDGENLTYNSIEQADAPATAATLADNVTPVLTAPAQKTAIAVMTPGCGYCRIATDWFAKQSEQQEIGLSVLMYATTAAEAERVAHFYCASENKFNALQEAYGKTPKAGWNACEAGMQTASRNTQITKSLGVYATPYFLVNSEPVNGFQPDLLANKLQLN